MLLQRSVYGPHEEPSRRSNHYNVIIGRSDLRNPAKFCPLSSNFSPQSADLSAPPCFIRITNSCDHFPVDAGKTNVSEPPVHYSFLLSKSESISEE
ncbi:hypothetical protein M514_14180 [Trichuris suis]|uniref:Uncharacterized protein n=1 Tax=Trichuris suis TaxID=68888 RepID=A0A085MQ23_9BILA|nr:hypothetical protein M513_14180 [Trichuris suis]KFD59319.1 hypothetical protein M514_14180 [Trichuris suis]